MAQRHDAVPARATDGGLFGAGQVTAPDPEFATTMSLTPRHAVDASAFRKADWPFYWLTRTNALYLQTLETALKAVGLDVPSWRVLASIHESGVASISEIADQAIVKLPTMHRIIQRMQADGLVVCRPRASDARVTEVLLTDAGRSAQGVAWAEAEMVYRKAFGDMSGRDIDKLNRLLTRLFANLEA